MITLLYILVSLAFAMAMVSLALALFLLHYLYKLYEEVEKKLMELGFE